MRKHPDLHIWIFLAGMGLTINAGFINAVVLLGFFHKAVSYMTGNLASVGIALHRYAALNALDVGGVVLSFLGGAILNGIIIGDAKFSLHNRYGIALMIQSLFVLLGMVFLNSTHVMVEHIGEYAVAVASGMQNAMTTTYSGAIIRTTHMTGIVTDLGIELGHWLRGDTYYPWRIGFFTASMGAFVLGSWLGGIGYDAFSREALLFSVASSFTIGIIFIFWK